jgi:inosine/xanthosine triphosphate pyrophosphatase family protein
MKIKSKLFLICNLICVGFIFATENPAQIIELQTIIAEIKEPQIEQKQTLTQEEIQHYLNGNLVPEATRDAIFEMNPLLSDHLIKIALPFYAERMYGKKWNELSDSEKEEATKKHKAYMETSAKNDIHTAAGIFHDMTELFTPFATQAQEYV